jgi:hypothetical protein
MDIEAMTIFADQMSESMEEIWRSGAASALEREDSALLYSPSGKAQS